MTAIVWPLTASAAAAFTLDGVRLMTPTQAATLTAAALNAMPAAVFGALTVAQVKAISVAAIGGLSATQAANLALAQIKAFTPAQTAALTAGEIAGLSAAQVAALNAANLTAAQTAAFSAAQTQALTVSQLNALSRSALGGVRAGSLTVDQARGLGAVAIGALFPAQIAALTTAEAAALSSAQAGALSATQINALSAAQLQALHLPALQVSVLKTLSGATLGNMTASEFAAAVGANVGQLTAAQVKSLTAAEINGLSAAQIAAFSAARAAALSTDAAAAYSAMRFEASGGGAVLSDFQSQTSNGSIGYAGLLKVLQDAAAGGVNGAEFSALASLAGKLNAAGGVSTSAYLQQIFADVVLGNSANAKWTGGAAASVALGNLTAGATEAQAAKLIGKWFLGTDLPSFQGVTSSGLGYQTFNLPLFGASGKPEVADVNQGQAGDCFFLSALVTEAQQNPWLIKNMIQSNGNGTYSVKFYVDGKDDYVTVNSDLAIFKGSSQAFTGSRLLFDSSTTNLWAPLIEKGYAELMSQSNVVTHSAAGHINSYSAISGGDCNGLMALTGQSVNEFSLTSATAASLAQAELAAAADAFNSHQGVMFATGNNNIGDFVSHHMCAVTGIDAAAGALSLHNPWGNAACAANGLHADFSVSLAQLQREGGMLEFTTGALPTV